MQKTFINSSNGDIEITAAGKVINTTDTSADQCISNIQHFNITEFLKYYQLEVMPASIDILDIGYWFNGASGKPEYEPPAQDWREEKKQQMAIELAELAYQKEIATAARVIKFYPQEAGSKWDAIEIHPVYDDGEGNADICEEGQETYWSIYLHQAQGGLKCVADMPSKELAMDVKALIKEVTATNKHGIL